MGLSFSVNKKKNCRINFQCRRKNVIMVVYGKSDRGLCPCVVSVNIQQIIGDETDGVVLTHRCVETICFPDVL